MVSIVDENDLREELSQFFNEIDDAVLCRLKELCIVYNMSEDTMASTLMAFITSRNRNESLSTSIVDDFEHEKLQKMALNSIKSSKKSTKNKLASNSSFVHNDFITKQFINDYKKEETRHKLTTSIVIADDADGDDGDYNMIDLSDKKTSEEKSTEFIDDINVSCMTSPSVANTTTDTINTTLTHLIPANANILCYFGDSHSDDEWKKQSNEEKHSVSYYDELSSLSDYKFMSRKIFECNQIMNDYIDEFSDIIRDKFEFECWSRFGVETPAESYFIGRIKCDSNKGKLDEKSVMMEGSSYITNNESIALDLCRLNHFSLFPGQILACKATNESGKNLILREVIDMENISPDHKLLPAPTFKTPLFLMVASGPFTLNGTLDFQPLKNVINYAKEYQPDFLILTGPFVDCKNEKLSTIEESVSRYFNLQMRFISEQLNDIKTEAIIIPSISDATNFNIYPTMPFNAINLKNLHFYPNPVVLNISGLVVGITSLDVLMHLSREEFYVGDSGDRLSRLCKHIITQQNFYPLFPPNTEVNVEFSKYDYLRLRVKPHLLILPSDLRQFVKKVSNCVVLNPGRVSKNTLARIKIDPINEETYNENTIEAHTNVEVIKIV